MSDQSIFLDWKTDTSKVDEAARKLNALNSFLATTKDTSNSIAVASARATTGIRETGNASANSAFGFMALANAVDDAQYGFRGVVNNIPAIVAGLGYGAGVAGVAMIAGVAVNQLANNWDKLTGSLGHAESAMQRTNRLLKEMGDGVKNPLQMANQQALLDRQQEQQRGRATFDQLRRAEGNDPELGKIAGDLVKEAIKPGVMESLAMRRSLELMATDPILANLYKQRDAFPVDSNSWDWAQTDVNKRKGRVLDFAQMEIGNIIAEIQAGNFQNLPVLQRHLNELGVGGDIKGQAEATKAAQSLKIQDAMDGAMEAVVKARQDEAKQLQERLRWERIRFDADQNAAAMKKAAQDAELARMDPRPFMDRAVDNLFGGGLNPFLVAQNANRLRGQGFNDAGVRAMQVQQLGGQIFQAGQMGQGPILTQMEANAQARRMLDNVAPEAGFLGDQIAKANAMKPKEVQVMERLAIAQETILAKGVAMILGRQRRPN